jgi:glutamine synthetase type III
MEVYIGATPHRRVEARTAIEMAKTIIFPAAVRYQGELAATCASLKVWATFSTPTRSTKSPEW